MTFGWLEARRVWVSLAAMAWLASLGVGLGAMGWYGSRPGDAGEVVGGWPAALGPRPAGVTVVMAVHPKCPCTSASVDELIRALSGSDASVMAVVTAPATEPEGWGEGAAVGRLRAATGARVVLDPGARIASGLGAMTSGHSVVFDGSGAVVFRGGVTPSRAHTGPNTGASSVRAVARGGTALASEAAVYGCPLRADDACGVDACGSGLAGEGG